MIENLDKMREFQNLGIDLYNKNDPFFNDRCNNQEYNNTDIPISLRRELLYEEKSLCEPNCEYEEYDINTDRVKCNCDIKNEINLEVNQEYSIDNFGESIVSSLNWDIIFCYDKLLDIKNYLHNYGFFFSSGLLIFNFTFNFLNFCCSLNNIINSLKNCSPKSNPIKKNFYKENFNSNNISSLKILNNDFQIILLLKKSFHHKIIHLLHFLILIFFF